MVIFSDMANSNSENNDMNKPGIKQINVDREEEKVNDILGIINALDREIYPYNSPTKIESTKRMLIEMFIEEPYLLKLVKEHYSTLPKGGAGNKSKIPPIFKEILKRIDSKSSRNITHTYETRHTVKPYTLTYHNTTPRDRAAGHRRPRNSNTSYPISYIKKSKAEYINEPVIVRKNITSEEIDVALDKIIIWYEKYNSDVKFIYDIPISSFYTLLIAFYHNPKLFDEIDEDYALNKSIIETKQTSIFNSIIKVIKYTIDTDTDTEYSDIVKKDEVIINILQPYFLAYATPSILMGIMEDLDKLDKPTVLVKQYKSKMVAAPRPVKPKAAIDPTTYPFIPCNGSDVSEINLIDSMRKKIKCEQKYIEYRPNYNNDVLKAMDTYHDFWHGTRSGEAIEKEHFITKNRLKLLLYYSINKLVADKLAHTDAFKTVYDDYLNSFLYLLTLPSLNNIIQNPHSQPFNDKYIKMMTKKTIIPTTNELFKHITYNKEIINISSIEKDTSEKFLCIPAANEEMLHNPATYCKMIKNMFGRNGYTNEKGEWHPYNIYIVSDSGPGAFGETGTFRGSRLRHVITQCTIGDSANTPTKQVGDIDFERNTGEPGRTIYTFVESPTATSPNVFISDSNYFTETDGYEVGYIDDGMSINKPYNIELFINTQLTARPFSVNFAKTGATQGPSASLLAAYFMIPTIRNIKRDNAFFTSNTVKKIEATIKSYIDTKGTKILQLYNSEGDYLYDIPGINPAIFFDIKRGGDRDQVISAVLFKNTLNPHTDRLVFCTGDLLCATIAIRAGLATVYQTKEGKMRYWPAGLNVLYSSSSDKSGGVGESKEDNENMKRGGGESLQDNKEVEKYLKQYINVNINDNNGIIDFISNIMYVAVENVRSKISNLYPEITKICSLYNLKNQIDFFYNDTTDNMMKHYKQTKDTKNYINFPLQHAIESFRRLNNNRDIITFHDILTHDKNTILSKINQKITEFEKTIKIKYDSQAVKDKLLNDVETDKKTIMYLRSLINDNWEKDDNFIKLLSNPTNKAIYAYFKNIIFSDTLINSKYNVYSTTLLSFALTHDFINNNVLTGGSVVSKLIYGTHPVKYKWTPISNTSALSYITLFKNIYENSKKSADFMNVVPQLLKDTSSIKIKIKTNKTKSNQQTRKNISRQQNTHKNIRPLIPVSQQLPASIAVLGGKWRTHKTQKRHRKYPRKLYTRHK